MKLQKLGGYASIVLVCGLVVTVVISGLAYSHLGIASSAAQADPAKMMDAYEASPITFRALQPFGILLALTFVLIALALQERMQAKAPNLMRLAVIAASITSALILTLSIASTSGFASIARTKDISAYKAFDAMLSGGYATAMNAWGWALLLMGWAAIRTGALPRILGSLIFVYGIAQIFQFAIAQLEIVSGILFLISMVWLGVVLLRKHEPASA